MEDVKRAKEVLNGLRVLCDVVAASDAKTTDYMLHAFAVVARAEAARTRFDESKASDKAAFLTAVANASAATRYLAAVAKRGDDFRVEREARRMAHALGLAVCDPAHDVPHATGTGGCGSARDPIPT